MDTKDKTAQQWLLVNVPFHRRLVKFPVITSPYYDIIILYHKRVWELVDMTRQNSRKRTNRILTAHKQ